MTSPAPEVRDWPTVSVEVGSSCVIHHSARLGLLREAVVRDPRAAENVQPVYVGNGSTVGAHVVVHDSTVIGNDCFIDDGCRIGFNCVVGDGTRLEYSAFVGDRVRIGQGCVIAGFVCDGVSIGDRAIAMGNFVHKLSAPHEPWGALEEAATVEDDAIVGHGATVVGGVVVGHGSYVAAGATITKNVPPGTVAVAINQFIPVADWRGSKLKL